MFDDEMMGYILDHARMVQNLKPRDPPVKAEISPDEALKIFNETLDLFRSHNISYQCACRICMSLTYAFITGAVELYRIDQLKP